MSKATRRVDHWQDPQAPKPTSRKTSASAFVQDEAGRVLLLKRVDNELWTIPTGAVKKGESVGQAAVRECREETGLDIEIVGLVGVFSTPDHVIAYWHGDRLDEVRQPINICVRGRVVGGQVTPEPEEAMEVRWVAPGEIEGYLVAPALRLRIEHGLLGGEPYIA
ncbi:NUDIX domain-containing protein [Nocardiopsis baichengensis]|uniref:NUDIX domain-containing protein n=1 Tax=Nocardiopsis baichengensis TaxID=280240 RepID=UPI00034AD612|nr:NUDIX domain-containing protein [Nocardiopsis baichengensis]